jgi:hypothetical protein
MKSTFWVDWIVAYILGILSSITATIVVLLIQSKRNIDKSLHILLTWVAKRRLQKLIQNDGYDINDARNYVREQWASALIDIGSNINDKISSAIESLDSMVDLLETDEKAAAHEVLKLKYASNPYRDLDNQYLDIMRKMAS